MSCAGYDIGNGSSAVAVAEGNALPVVLHDDSTSDTPSVVYFVQKRRRFGLACETSEVLNPESTISQLKCLVGKQFNSVREELQDLPFRTSEDKDGGGILVHVNHNREEYRFKPVHILAMLLSHLAKMVEGYQQMPHCVIGVPSYFTDRERMAYRDAAKIVGLENMQLMHEGSAIALAYRFKKATGSDEPSYVVFVDIGHCDTQITVVRFDGDGIHVLAHASDPKLGGRDFTNVLYLHFAKEFKDKHKTDISVNCRARAQLVSECEKLKKVLTKETEAHICLDNLMYGKDLVGSITRKKFEELSSVLLERLWTPCHRALRDARVAISEEYSVELVGSGSRIPRITSILEEKFQRKICRSLDAKECVVHGCALQARTLSEVDSQLNIHRVHDSLPFDVWWRTLPPQSLPNSSLFYKGAKFPTTKTIGVKDMKEPFDLHIEIFNDGGSPMTKSYKVGIGNILMPNDLIPTVEAKIGIDHDGITCLLSATLKLITPHYSLGDENMIKTKEGPSSDLLITKTKIGLASADFSEILELENKLVSLENSVLEAQDRKHDLQVYIYATIKKLNTGVYGDNVSSFEKVTYMNRLREMEKWLEDHDEEESLAYVSLLDSLKEMFHVIDERQKSTEDCIEATKELEKSISNRKESAASFSEEQRDSVNLVCSRAEEWLKACQRLQNFLPKNIDKSQVACDTRDMTKSLQESCELIESNCALWRSNNSTCTSWTTYQFDDWDQDYTQMMVNQADDQFINNEERASAIYCLLYCIFRHRVAVICARTHEKDAVNKECGTFEEWLITKWKKQELSPTNIDSSILCAEEIEQNRKKLNRVCQKIQETILSKAREDLINYISEVQEELEGRYASFTKEEEKSTIFDRIKSIVAITNEESNYGSEEFYINHLMELENLVSPIRKRCTDKDRREASVRKFHPLIFKYRKLADMASDRQVKDKVESKCTEVDKWLRKKTNLQESLPNYAEPVLCSDELDEKLQDVKIFCEQQLNKDRSIGYKRAAIQIKERYGGSLFLSILTSDNKGVEDMVKKHLPEAKKKSDILGELEFEIPKGVTAIDVFKALDRVHPNLSVKRYGLAAYPTRR